MCISTNQIASRTASGNMVAGKSSGVLHFESTKAAEKVLAFNVRTIERVAECRERRAVFVGSQGEVTRHCLEAAFPDLSVPDAAVDS